MKKIFSLKNIVLALNCAVILAIFIMNFFYQRDDFNFTLKCVCSVCFACLGLINLGYAIYTKQTNMKFYIIMAIGLVFAMVGDIVINSNFIGGAASFAIGHIFFIVAYCMLKNIKWLEFVISSVVFVAAGAFLVFCPLLEFGSVALKCVCVGYALIISLMFGKAVSNFVYERNVFYALLAVGSFLFVFSDLMLVLNNFMGTVNWAGYACMATYYPALCLFALSMFISTLKKEKTAQ